MTDQHRYDELSALGTPGAETPAIDLLASTGFMFTHSFVPTPQCSPTRAAILTGRFPHRTGVVSNVGPPLAALSAPLDPSIPGLGSVFAKAGYQTAYFGKWHLGHSPSEHGFETFRVTADPELSLDAAEFFQERQQLPEKKPLLLIISWTNPHDIYLINQPQTQVREDIEAQLPISLHDDLSTKPFPQRHFLEADQGVPFIGYTDDQWRRYVRFYHQLTTEVDADVGRVVDLVDEYSPRSLIVFTSEHGDLGGAHGLPYKGPAMYEELIRVPLVISWPDQILVGESDALVSSIDLLPTLCDLAGIDPPGDIDGRSLRPLLEGQTVEESGWQDTVFGEYYGKQSWRVPIRMVRTRLWKYMRYVHYGEELYDLLNDPYEMENLADRSDAQEVKRQLAASLEEWMIETSDPFHLIKATDRSGREIDPRRWLRNRVPISPRLKAN